MKVQVLPHPCNVCYYKSVDKSNLERHIQTQHEGLKFPGSKSNNNMVRFNFQHEGIKYTCNHCEYNAGD